MPSIRLRISGFVTVLVVSCGGGNSSGPPPPTNTIVATGGAGQSDTVLATLTTPLAVQVHDQNNSPVSGVSVTWTAPAGGKVNGSTSVVSVTSASGAASVTLTLGTAAGTQSATASASGVTGSPVSFQETATPGNPFSLALSTQSATSGPPSTTLTYSVIAKDNHGNGVSGVPIAWAATFGGGSVTPPTNATGAGGIASTQHQLGPTDGQDTVSATSGTLQGSPVKIAALIKTPPPPPATASVDIGDNFFKSAANATENPAVDTIAVGGKVTWTWGGANSHSVHSTGSPSFTSSSTATSGTYSFTFNAAGTYQYNCIVHGNAMTGTIVVK
jgi:plastocyanin